jgi:hypothetical protein
LYNQQIIKVNKRGYFSWEELEKKIARIKYSRIKAPKKSKQNKNYIIKLKFASGRFKNRKIKTGGLTTGRDTVTTPSWLTYKTSPA